MKILIVDDEQPARERLRQIIGDIGKHEVVGDAGNGQDAVAMAAELAPDVVLLDIRMPGMDGIETAHHLNAMEQAPAVVFTTAYDEYAIDAFDARAIGYVLKPIRQERLEGALDHAARLSGNALADLAQSKGIESQRKHVCARVKDELRLIPIADIRYFSADQKYTCVYHEDGHDLIDDSLKSLEKEFTADFVRIHRGVLVKVGSIDRIDRDPSGKSRVILRGNSPEDDEALIISRRHLADVRRRLKGG